MITHISIRALECYLSNQYWLDETEKNNMTNLKEKTMLLATITGLAAVPYVVIMLSEMNLAGIATKIVALGLGLV